MPAPAATPKFLPPLPDAPDRPFCVQTARGLQCHWCLRAPLVPRLQLSPMLPAGMEGSPVMPAPTAIPRPLPAAGQQGSKDRLAGKRFGVYWDYFQDAEPEVVRICRQALDTIRDNGGQVTFAFWQVFVLSHSAWCQHSARLRAVMLASQARYTAPSCGHERQLQPGEAAVSSGSDQQVGHSVAAATQSAKVAYNTRPQTPSMTMADT